MKIPDNIHENEKWVGELNSLAEQVKILALNLAINLAKAKHNTRELAFMEPQFTKLVHGSVEVIKEITAIMRVFRNEEKMVYTPPASREKLNNIETSLNEILNLSQKVLTVIADIKNKKNNVDIIERAGGKISVK